MKISSMNTRKLAAGTAAVVLTLAAAGTAVAVNLDATDAGPTSAGKLAATEQISADAPTSTVPVTPSTIYLDVTVPVPAPSTPSPSAGAAVETAPVDAVPSDVPSGVPSDDAGYDDHGDDGQEYEDDDSDDEDSDDSVDDVEGQEHEDGHDDDD